MAEPNQHPSRIPIIALITANGISLLGTQITTIAIPRFVLQTAGSAARIGIASVLALLPIVIAACYPILALAVVRLPALHDMVSPNIVAAELAEARAPPRLMGALAIPGGGAPPFETRGNR